jgi:cyclopropane-fatty-acyl-phospholipid synthase
MFGDVQVDDLRAVMNVLISLNFLIINVLTIDLQLWLDNQAGMEGMSTLGKFSSTISAISNAFLGQTRSQARLNAIASYDQSNDLFKVC